MQKWEKNPTSRNKTTIKLSPCKAFLFVLSPLYATARALIILHSNSLLRLPSLSRLLLLTLQLPNRQCCEVFTLYISAVHYKTLRQIQPHSMFFAGGQRGSQTSLRYAYISQHRAPLSFTLLGLLLSPKRQAGLAAFPFSPLSVLALKISDICSC